MKKGFTLAEVLITLGIVGVVAAVSLPTLIANTHGAANRNKFKKTVSTISQAAKMSLAKNDFSFADVNTGCGSGGSYCSDNAMADPDVSHDVHSVCKILETSLKGYIYKTAFGDSPVYEAVPELQVINNVFLRAESFNSYGYYILPDGSLIGVSVDNGVDFAYGESACSVEQGKVLDKYWIDSNATNPFVSPCLGFIDVNGPNGPNKEVACSNNVPTTTEVEKPCKVETKDITDIFPIVFHDATVEPASNAAAYVLKTSSKR